MMVTRLDGPTPELAKGLVDKALYAEAHGLSGNAYIDLRNITSGGYRTGDEWITNAATTCKRFGFSTFVDNRPETLPESFPMSQIALYFGWYAWSADGPFTRPEVEFMPGAIAYHIHSFSAADLRSRTANWVGHWGAAGVPIGEVAKSGPPGYLRFVGDSGLFRPISQERRRYFGGARRPASAGGLGEPGGRLRKQKNPARS